METAHFYVLYGLSGITIALCAVLLYRIKTVTYLLEQPVVKKMSPQLKLKPVKIDEVEDAARNSVRNAGPAAPALNRGPAPRPEGQDRQARDRDRMPRSERPEGDRGPRPEGDRGPRNDRGDRGDRGDRFRDRDRGGRNERHDRGGDRGRRPDFASGESRDPAPADALRPATPRVEGIRSETSDIAPSHPAPLSPRRPLPSTVDHEADSKSLASSDALAVNEAGAADPFYRGDDSDIQHGRRNQLKKKPRFNMDEEETKASTEETKVL